MKFVPAAALLFAILLSCKPAPHEVPPLFEDASARTGLNFWQFSGAVGDFRIQEIIGSGAALFDYDNDGDLDVFLVQGTPAEPGTLGKPLVPVPGDWKAGNRLFRNNLAQTGKLSFTDVTEQAGVGYKGVGMGVAAGDYDNDGFVDLYVTNYGHNVLYHNNGNGTFTDVTNAANVGSSGWSTSAAFLDYDRDGLLDLAVVHYLDDYPAKCYSGDGGRDYCNPQVFQRTVTQLFRNLGNGRFAEVTSAVGLNAARGPGLGILTGDFSRTGWPGFLVTNDGAANHLWLNDASPGTKDKGRVFRETGLTSGLAYAADGRARAGMGVAAADIYSDGGESVVVTNLPNEGFTLFQRQPGGDYSDVSVQSRVYRASLPYAGFGVGWLDIENRGLLDMFATNGAVIAMADQRGQPFPYYQRNLLLRNQGKEKGFEDVTASAGPALQPAGVGRAAAFGDVNNDGGTDILITNNNGPARLLLNVAPQRGHWVSVRLEGMHSNRSGYGSVVELFRKDGTVVRGWVRGDGSYLTANDPRVQFGLGNSAAVDRIQVRWLAGGCDVFKQVAIDRVLTLREGGGQPCPEPAPR